MKGSTRPPASKITAQRRPSKPQRPSLRGEPAGQKDSGIAVRSFIYFWPLYTGEPIPVDQWQRRMWLDTWV
ncbi:hypothetical protein B9S66_19165 [Streptomyces sp. SM17]|nr:hypothetical protein B9S66_19165 [Streptomyces sp. SM17]